MNSSQEPHPTCREKEPKCKHRGKWLCIIWSSSCLSLWFLDRNRPHMLSTALICNWRSMTWDRGRSLVLPSYSKCWTAYQSRTGTWLSWYPRILTYQSGRSLSTVSKSSFSAIPSECPWPSATCRIFLQERLSPRDIGTGRLGSTTMGDQVSLSTMLGLSRQMCAPTLWSSVTGLMRWLNSSIFRETERWRTVHRIPVHLHRWKPRVLFEWLRLWFLFLTEKSASYMGDLVRVELCFCYLSKKLGGQLLDFHIYVSKLKLLNNSLLKHELITYPWIPLVYLTFLITRKSWGRRIDKFHYTRTMMTSRVRSTKGAPYWGIYQMRCGHWPPRAPVMC